MSETVLPTEMNTVDENYGFTDAVNYVTEPSYTYKLNAETQQFRGYVDEQEAFRQAVYKLLNTERYEYIIYSYNYGIELKELIGKHIAYVVPELQRRITEAIMQDDRAKNVSEFEFDISKRGVVGVTFTVESIYGEVKMEKTVEI